MKRAAGGGARFFKRVSGERMDHFRDQSRSQESFLDIIALEVDVWVNFMRYSVVAIVAIEADVVGGSPDPQSLSVNFKWRLPDAQVIARGYDLDRFGVRPAVVLGTTVKVQWAHWHGEVRLFGNTFEDAVEDGSANVGVYLDPASRGENF